MDDLTCDRCGATISHLEEVFLASDPETGGDSLVCPSCLTAEERSKIEGDRVAFLDEMARSEEWHA
ncbi:MAG: hypothetical protein ACJ77E_06285 [Gaiellaceae bacterium]